MASNSQRSEYVTVANQTDDTLTVDMSINQFKVADYSYQYAFRPVEYDWITFKQDKVSLKSGERANVYYAIHVPEHAAAGSYYFALFAAARMSDSGVSTTARVTSLLTLTVDGDKAASSVAIANDTPPRIVTGLDIPVTFDIKNTGNLYLEGYSYAHVHTLWDDGSERRDDLTLISGTTRSARLTLPVPLLPGVYKVTYGYVAKDGRATATKTAYVVNLPLWSLAGTIFLVLLGLYVRQSRRRRRGAAVTKS